MPCNLILLVLLLLSFNTFGATWYVCPNDVNTATSNGTSPTTDCFDGLADLNATLASVNPGDTVCYVGNFTTADAMGATTYLNYFNKSGTAGNLITLDGDCDGDGVKASINAGGTVQRAMQTADNNYLVIKNLELKNATARGLLLYNTATDATDRGSISVTQMNVHDITGGASPIGIDSRGLNVSITNNIVNNIGEDGIYHKGPNVVITGNTISYISTAGSLGDCIQLDGAYLNFTISNNSCDHTNVASKQCIIASNPTDAGYGILSGNSCLRPTGEGVSTTYGYYIETASGNSVITRNYYKGGRTAIQYLGAGTADIRSNVGIVLDTDLSTAARCVSLGGSAGKAYVENNSCSGGYQGIVSSSAAAAVIRNNAVANVTDDCINKAAGDSESYNKCFNYGGDLVSNNGTGTAAGAGTANTNQLWIGGASPTSASGFILKPSSTLRRAGISLNVGNLLDYSSHSFQNPPSIGAYDVTSNVEASSRSAATTRSARN